MRMVMDLEDTALSGGLCTVGCFYRWLRAACSWKNPWRESSGCFACCCSVVRGRVAPDAEGGVPAGNCCAFPPVGQMGSALAVLGRKQGVLHSGHTRLRGGVFVAETLLEKDMNHKLLSMVSPADCGRLACGNNAVQ